MSHSPHKPQNIFQELMLLVLLLPQSSCTYFLEEDTFYNEVAVMDGMWIAYERTSELPHLILKHSEESSSGCATNLLAVAVDSLAGRVYVCRQLNEDIVEFKAYWKTSTRELVMCESKNLTQEDFFRTWKTPACRKVLVDTLRLSEHGLAL